MKPLSDFHSRVLPWVPGCPEPTLNQALLDSSIAFCESSLVVREHLDVFQTTAGVAVYELDAPTQQQVARILGVSVEGRVVQLVPAERSAFPTTTTGKPTSAFTRRTGSEFVLHLHPTPDAAYPVQVQVATRPLRSATQLEDDLHNLWIEAIAAGAVARICAIPGQSFSDPVTAQKQAMVASNYTAKARVEGSYNRVRGQMTVTPRAFA